MMGIKKYNTVITNRFLCNCKPYHCVHTLILPLTCHALQLTLDSSVIYLSILTKISVKTSVSP